MPSYEGCSIFIGKFSRYSWKPRKTWSLAQRTFQVYTINIVVYMWYDENASIMVIAFTLVCTKNLNDKLVLMFHMHKLHLTYVLSTIIVKQNALLVSTAQLTNLIKCIILINTLNYMTHENQSHFCLNWLVVARYMLVALLNKLKFWYQNTRCCKYHTMYA